MLGLYVDMHTNDQHRLCLPKRRGWQRRLKCSAMLKMTSAGNLGKATTLKNGLYTRASVR